MDNEMSHYVRHDSYSLCVNDKIKNSCKLQEFLPLIHEQFIKKVLSHVYNN
jgi:hypothetical protein